MEPPIELLSVGEMASADKAAIAGGVPGERLMENAGAGAARHIVERWSPRPVAVLCGPGNNGGDGFVVARHLGKVGWPVKLALLGSPQALTGDAAIMAKRWDRPIAPLDDAALEGAALVVDGMFGAGLSRPIAGVPAALIERLNADTTPVVAIDVPSGVDGDTGAVLGTAPRAALTVTFFRRKPGHLLLPGRLHCGEVVTTDIGIPAEVLGAISPRTFENTPALWRAHVRVPSLLDHKYSRGHVVVAGGAAMTGAARLAARGAIRTGAGMVTIASPPAAVPIYATEMAGVLVTPIARPADFVAFLEDPRMVAILVGPGNGVSDATRAHALAALATGRPVVLDADALTVFAGSGDVLAGARRGECVLTPHEGEFTRLFGDRAGSKLARARAVAAETGAVMVLKGGDTVVAAPDGRAAIAANAPAWLATAGAGDVLAGLVLALLGQGMPAFEASCAAVWLHGAAATRFGPGLIAEDLPDQLPAVLRNLFEGADPI
ncbi:MAG TPA: NAD(P)H-hydrate dehydratase [Alphaproteobacteria bacterium]|nr:NAD(P)H-hydrate dehydratase [Alphaproteobacteria bacterium]